MGLFTGKRIVLTAPAPHIVEEKQDLSRYDYVCRLNAMIPLSERLKEATGERIDVWFPSNKLLREKPELCELPKIIRTSKKGGELIPKQYFHKVSYMNNHHDRLKAIIGCVPNRGLRAIIDILKDKPKELYITGLTFYKTGGYFEDYTYFKDSNEKTVLSKGNMGGHLQEPQFEYFLKNIVPFVTMDKVLEDLCEVRK